MPTDKKSTVVKQTVSTSQAPEDSNKKIIVQAVLDTTLLGTDLLGDALKDATIAAFMKDGKLTSKLMGNLIALPTRIPGLAISLEQNIRDADGNFQKGLEETAKDFIIDKLLYSVLPPHIGMTVVVSEIFADGSYKLADKLEKAWPISSDLDEVGSEDLQALLRAPGAIVAAKDTLVGGIKHGVNEMSVLEGIKYIYTRIINAISFPEPLLPAPILQNRLLENKDIVPTNQTIQSDISPIAISDSPSHNPTEIIISAPVVPAEIGSQTHLGISCGIDEKQIALSLTATQTGVSTNIDAVSGSMTLFKTAGGDVGVSVAARVDTPNGVLKAGVSTAGSAFIGGTIAASPIVLGSVVSAAVIFGSIYGLVRHTHKKREAHQIPFLNYGLKENKDLALGVYNLSKRALKDSEARKFRESIKLSRAFATTPEEHQTLDLLSYMLDNPTSEIKSILSASYSDDKYKKLNANDFSKLYEYVFNKDIESFKKACDAGDAKLAQALCRKLIEKYPDNHTLVDANVHLSQLIEEKELIAPVLISGVKPEVSEVILPQRDQSEQAAPSILTSIPPAININNIIKSGHKGIFEYYQQHRDAIQSKPELLNQFKQLLQIELAQAIEKNDFTKINDIQKNLSTRTDFPVIYTQCEAAMLKGQLMAGIALEALSGAAVNSAKDIKDENARTLAVATCGSGEIGGKILSGIAQCKLEIIRQKEALSKELLSNETKSQRKIEIEAKLTKLNSDFDLLSSSKTYYVVSSIMDTLKKYHAHIYKIDPEEQTQYYQFWDGLSVIADTIGIRLDAIDGQVSPNTVAAATKVAAILVDTASDIFWGENINTSESALITTAVPMGTCAVARSCELASSIGAGDVLSIAESSASLGALGVQAATIAIEQFFPPEEVDKIIERGEYLPEDAWISGKAIYDGTKKTANQIQSALSVKTLTITIYSGSSWLYTAAGSAASSVLPSVITSYATGIGGAVAGGLTSAGAAVASYIPATLTLAAGSVSSTVMYGATAAGGAIASAPLTAGASGTTFVICINAAYAQKYLNLKILLINSEIAADKADFLLAREKLKRAKERDPSKEMSIIVEEKELLIELREGISTNSKDPLELADKILAFVKNNPSRTVDVYKAIKKIIMKTPLDNKTYLSDVVMLLKLNPAFSDLQEDNKEAGKNLVMMTSLFPMLWNMPPDMNADWRRPPSKSSIRINQYGSPRINISFGSDTAQRNSRFSMPHANLMNTFFRSKPVNPRTGALGLSLIGLSIAVGFFSTRTNHSIGYKTVALPSNFSNQG